MSDLLFDKLLILDDQARSNICISNEPDNKLANFYIAKDRQCNEIGQLTLSDYDNVSWEYESSLLTAQAVSSLGVKSFPRVGSVGFYNLKHENKSVVVAPVFVKDRTYKAPELFLEMSEETLKITVIPPKDVSFDCYRVSIRKGFFTEDFITYDKKMEIPKPSAGLYTIYVVGYLDEIVASKEGVYVDTVVIGATSLSSYGKTGRSKPDQTSAESFGVPVKVVNGYQVYTVPETGTYYLEACGGAGGRGGGDNAYTLGGLPAVLSGYANLTSGDKLYICVGQKGTDHPYTGSSDSSSGSGGGMTVIAIEDPSSEDVLTGISLGEPSDPPVEPVHVRLLMCAGGGNGGMDGRYANNRTTANALLSEGANDKYLSTARSGGGFRASNSDKSSCGRSFLESCDAATSNYSRNGTSIPGFGGGGKNDDDGFGGGGGGYRGGIPSSDTGGSSFNACSKATAKLASSRSDGYIKILRV